MARTQFEVPPDATVGQGSCATQSMLPLTSLRFFAALLVLHFHFGAGFLARNGAPDVAVSIFRNGFLGVSLFFVLSGFILFHAHRHDAFAPRDLARYAIARFARIYPVYALALLLACPFALGALTGGEAAAVLAMVQSWTPPASPLGFAWIMQAWTLSVEAFFYLLFPLLWLLLRSASLWKSLTVAVGTAVLIVLLGLSSVSPGVLTIPFFGTGSAIWIPIFRMPEFVFGMALYRLLDLCPRAVRELGCSGSQLVLAAAIVLALMFARDVHSQAIVTLVAGLLILSLARGSGIVSRLFSHPVLVLLGGASYSMYILQGPIREYARLFVPAPWDQFASPIATVLLSVIVFAGYEQPVRRLVVTFFARRRVLAPGRPGGTPGGI